MFTGIQATTENLYQHSLYGCVYISVYTRVELFSIGNMTESKAHQVEIREVDGQTLRKLVDYIYTAEIEVTEDNVQVGEEKHLCISFVVCGVFDCCGKTSQGFICNGDSFNDLSVNYHTKDLLCWFLLIQHVNPT